MNEFLRDRILRKLETLSDERVYQVLDYIEFLESRYAERPAPSTNVLQRFAEGIEDRLRAGRVSASTIAETMNLMNRAMNVLGGVAAAGKSVANDLVGAAGEVMRSTGTTSGTITPGASSSTGAAPSGVQPALTPPPSTPQTPPTPSMPPAEGGGTRP